MSRPPRLKKPPKKAKTLERLDCLLRFRCSRAEHARIVAQAKAAGLRPSEYLRRVGSDGKLSAPDPLIGLVAALNRAGNNVNQQMAIAHVKGELPAVLVRLDEELERAVQAVLQRLDTAALA